MIKYIFDEFYDNLKFINIDSQEGVVQVEKLNGIIMYELDGCRFS